jgi:hypothetical protein
VPTVLRIKRLRFFFFSNEGKEPPHIHIESGEKYAKFWLDLVNLAKSVGYSAKELVEIRNLIFENIDTLRGKWDEFFKR